MIYIDASRYNNTSKKTGVENYSYYLINELVRQAPDEITLISPKKIDLPVPQIIIPFPRLWTQLRLSGKLLGNKKIDNLFVPSHLMPVIHPQNTTITIHDVAWRRTPKSYGRLSRWYLDWGTKYAVKHAKKIITPSETSKKDLIKFFKADPKKIHVIPLGFQRNKEQISERKSKEILENCPPPPCGVRTGKLKTENYFLYLGRIETKKNTALLIEAFKESLKKHPGIKLVLAGKTGVGGNEILKKIDQNIIVTGYVSEEEKRVLLKNALAFVFPSLFEGFGIPLLEAMDANVPIIASQIPTSCEIAKNNALFFKPHDIKMLTHHLNQLAGHKDLRKKLTEHHAETLKKYSWKKCAEATLGVLRK